MGSATKSSVVALSPIQEVVITFLSRLRPIGDLVIDEARRGEKRVSEEIFVGLVIIFRVTRWIIRKWRSGLDRQCVRAHMIRLQRNDLFDGVLPIGDRLTSSAVDEVEVQSPNPACSCESHCLGNRVGIVVAPQRNENLSRERLDTKRKPVNASTNIGSDMGISHRFRIAFNRDLCAGRNGYRRNDAGKPDWINQRGGAAADKDRRRHW